MTEPSPQYSQSIVFTANGYGHCITLTETNPSISSLKIDFPKRSFTYTYSYKSLWNSLAGGLSVTNETKIFDDAFRVSDDTSRDWGKLDLTIDSSPVEIIDDFRSRIYLLQCQKSHVNTVKMYFSMGSALDIIVPSGNCKPILHLNSNFATRATLHEENLYIWYAEPHTLSSLTILCKPTQADIIAPYSADNISFSPSIEEGYRQLTLFGIKHKIPVPTISFKLPEPTTDLSVGLEEGFNVQYHRFDVSHEDREYRVFAANTSLEPIVILTTDGIGLNYTDQFANPFTGRYESGWKVGGKDNPIRRENLLNATKVKLYAFNGQTPIPGVVEVPVSKLFK